MKRLLVLAFLLALAASQCFGQKKTITEEFGPVCRELDSLLYERTTVKGELGLRAVMKRGGYLDFYFNNSLSDMPWTEEDSRWFRNALKERFPEQYSAYRPGRISSRGERLENLVTGELGNGGSPSTSSYLLKNHEDSHRSIVERLDGPVYPDGMEGRHIALWQSHGLYYEQSQGRWEWQRPCLFQTVEDLFTQSFVLPFLVPMLENAGAYVMLPRERDLQTHEIIIDNDSSEGYDNPRALGTYSETGEWKDAGTGFADAKTYYEGTDNPFAMGTARMADCMPYGSDSHKTSSACWTPDIPERGNYAVYVSYRTLPNSTDAAHYTVRHAGGTTEFNVNQQMGGGTWIYLGTFEFLKGKEGCITLDNILPERRKSGKKTAVTADGVKIGGGYGNIARSIEGDTLSVPETSGMPRFTEGARYWLQWAGIDSTIYSLNGRMDDYTDDFMCRGDWVAYMSGGSHVNPGKEGKKIPFDLAFALHSDAGVTPNDSTIGTLAIYTLKSEGRRRLPSGEDRKTSREFANLVQSQIVRDVRERFDPDWNRRFIWDRGYRESRTPTCPSMLCEMLSHQNFADMKLAHDPAFKFTVSRAIYKGMLKYLSNRYGVGYRVQPLPVNSLSAVFDNGKILLRWKQTEDPSEPTSDADGFIIRTRTDDGAFCQGRLAGTSVDRNGYHYWIADCQPGHLYSFTVEAYNSGGKSFPSEVISAGIPENRAATDSCVLIVNNFDRVSAPAWFDYPEFAGFDNRLDSGVPYIREIAFTGSMYQNRRDLPWTDDDRPGFGASYNDYAGSVIAGNTFDYPSVHGKAVMAAGYPFCSASAKAFCSDSVLRRDIWCIDMICGKQVTVKSSRGNVPDRFTVFPEKMQQVLTEYVSAGGNLLVSGADIGTDIWDKVYPVETDSVFRAASIAFAEKILGYSYAANYAGRTGKVSIVPYQTGLPELCGGEEFAFNNMPDSRLYSVEAPDGIVPSGNEGSTFLRYTDTRISAGVCCDFGTYRTVCIGFPIEIITDAKALDRIVRASLGYFRMAARSDKN